MQIKKEVTTLLSSSNLPAHNITRSLKQIGDGSMLTGLQTMCTCSYVEGKHKGHIECGVAVATAGGIVFLCNKLYKIARTKILEIKQHREIADKIHTAFEEECVEVLNEEVN